MYINKIDELIDKIIDDFYGKIYVINKDFKDILQEPNFVKYQLKINTILDKYIKTLNNKEIREVVDSEDNVVHIIDIIKRYLAFYLFLVIGYHYKGKKETYINNVIEFSRNQSTFNFKINNFFNSENNSILIKFFEIVVNTVLLLTLEPSKQQIALKKPDFKTTIEFLNSLGQEFIVKNFKIDSLNNKKNEQAHNIIKTIILNELYYKIEKKDVYSILTSVENKDKEFTFINIVIPRTSYIDYNAIENILTASELKAGYAAEIYKFIINNEYNSKTNILSADEKINILISNSIIIPIVDDFLLYHKDNEKYEKTTGSTNYKKKEDTKIRYIITKIDNVSEYYSDNIIKNKILKKNIEKHFYTPLTHRKAILINNSEEIKIVNKLYNHGRRSIENNEYYNDLMNYRQYPYINFKDFKDYGFSLNFINTKDAIRYSSFEYMKENDNLQLRIVNKHQAVNIVGIAIPSKTIPIECLYTRELVNVRDIGNKKNKDPTKKSINGYTNILKFLKYIYSNNKKHRSSIYWKFIPKLDTVKLEKYEQLSKLNNQENLKLIVSKLYDDLLLNMYGNIVTDMEKHKQLSLYMAFKIIKKHEYKMFEIPKTNEVYNLLEKYIYYEKIEKSEKRYDINEDKFGGLFGDVIKLPEYKKSNNENIKKIKIVQDFITDIKIDEITDAEKLGAICQHFLSWDKIVINKRNNPTDYSVRLYEFVNQYVLENHNQDYVCKSCGTQLNIKKYITDGVFDNDSEKFVTFSMPMEIPLEDIPEYEKFKTAISIIDKQIENLASISSIPYYVGSSMTLRSRRKNIVKNVLDMLKIHNKNMRKGYKDRHEKISSTYGINKELTNMFVFELDNSIFVFSSKDKDFYKPIKHNNILMYIVFMLLVEINKSQILFMNSNKTCNYYWFDKYGHYLFNNLSIIVNDKGDKKPIKNYKILCYLIYYTTCLITKYKMWYYDTDKKIPKKKLIPMIHSVIVNTLVDIINSILEVNQRKNKHFIYTMISNRFFIQLNDLYQDNHLSKTLKRTYSDKMSALLGNKKYIVSKLESIRLSNYKPMNFGMFETFKTDLSSRYYLPLKIPMKIKYSNINNITNCEQGTFHKWKTTRGTFECEICKKTINDIKLNDKNTTKASINYIYDQLQKLATLYCKSGQKHNFIFDSKRKLNICRKCNFATGDKLSNSDLDKLQTNLKNKENVIEEDDYDNKQKSSYEFLKQLNDEYNKTIKHGEQFGHINKFINMVQSAIGKDVNIHNKNIFIMHDAYIINHNHNGQNLDKPIIITDKNKITYKNNHQFFKRDVIYYTNNKFGKIDVFYDADTFILLGYKESNKDYSIIKKTNKYIIINYSLRSRIQLLGHSTKYINFAEKVKEYKKIFKIDNEFIIKKIVAEINRTRIIRLKRIITDFQRYIYRLIYNFEEKHENEEEKRNVDFMSRYYKKLNSMKIKDGNNKNMVFKDWKIINDNIFMKNIKRDVINVNINEKTISVSELSKHDYSGNLILYYIIREITKLIEYNNNKFTRATIVSFLIDVINEAYSLYNDDVIFKNPDIKRFSYIIKSNRFVHDIQQQGHGLNGQVEGFYGIIKDDNKDVDEERERLEDAIEERDALDVDTEIDYESGIDKYTF
jgi:hypothetical protein